MVALETPAAPGPARPNLRRGGPSWSIAAGAVLVVGLGLRLALGGGGVGDRSAIVMVVLVTVGVWLAALLLSTPRTAFLVALGVVVLLDLAALPSRNAPIYDVREAFYRTDQVLTAQVSTASVPGAQVPTAPGSVGSPQAMLMLFVEPVFPTSAAQPRFGLAGEVGGAALAWECAFQRGPQQLALPLAPTALTTSAALDVQMHLTGSPSRETDYLLVYASAPRGGFLLSLVGPGDVSPSATTCSLRA